jgi:hypothetical protein
LLHIECFYIKKALVISNCRFDEALKEAVTADKLVSRTIKESGNPLQTGYALQR